MAALLAKLVARNGLSKSKKVQFDECVMSKSGNAGRKVGKGSRLWEQDQRPPKGEPWIWLTRKMLESPAFRAMSLPARKVLDRLCLENMAHAGMENGDLIVTFANFREFGISGRHVSGAIDEVEALGFVTIKRGRGGNAEFRKASRYALTWLPAEGGRPLNSWRSITKERVAMIKQWLKEKRPRKKNPGPPSWSEAGPPEWSERTAEIKH